MIAITGMAGIFPGAPDLDTYWENLRQARVAPLTPLEAVWQIPRERYFSPTPNAPDRTYLDQAFLLPLDETDQDRQVLAGGMVARTALTQAGLAGDGVALVAGTSWTGESYFHADALEVWAALGLDVPDDAVRRRAPIYPPDAQLDEIAARAGISGPRLAVDTACASSLYAIDVALGLLTTGQVEAAVVLGLNALMPPFLLLGFARLGALSPTGRILPFAANADGIVCGEGVGALVLEPAARARAAGRTPLGLVRSLGLSSDGADRSIFAPGPTGQRLAYERAYAQVAPETIDYLEAHGTATVVGDETELATLEEFLRSAGRRSPLPVGSVKALVGHTLAAAGIASVIKGLLMLQRGELVPHVPVDPHPCLGDSLLQVPRRSQPWPAGSRPRRLGISSMGFGGANAHLVLEGAEGLAERRPAVAVATAPTVDAPALPAAPAAGLPAVAIIDLATLLGADGPSMARLGPFHDRVPAESRLLPAQLTVEGQGLRTGPHVLRRSDPVQLLASHLAHRVTQRHPQVGDAAETAVVMTGNLGGELALRLWRRHAYRLTHPAPAPEVEQLLGPSLTVEAIAGGLPALLSGYAAFHLDLRAFHATFAGGPGTFLTTLLLAPYWLGRRCQALLLGAVRTLKSPVDLRHASLVPPAEGAGVLLLRPLVAAQAAGDPIRAVVRVTPGRGGDLDGPRAVISLTDGPAPLGEATGLAEIVAHLASDEPRLALELRRGAEALATIVIDHGDASLPDEPSAPFKTPVAVPLTLSPQRPPAARPSRAPVLAPLTGEGSWTVARALEWLESSSRSLHAFLSAQRAALPLTAITNGASPTAPATPLAADGSAPPDALATPTRRDPRNVVIRDACRVGEVVRAELVVDEGHPYYFDHPLDHLPGILILEGMVQLAEAAAPSGDRWARVVEARFRRFCEKDRPVTLELTPSGAAGWQGLVRQDQRTCATFFVERPLVPTTAAGGTAAPPRTDETPPAPSLLHKHHAENVLVGPLEALPDGIYRCALVPPPPEHTLRDHPGPFLGPLFLLEAAREVVTLGAHTVLGVPDDAPMILLSFRLGLEQPVTPTEPLELRYQPQPLTAPGGLPPEVRLSLRVGRAIVGTVSVRGQVVDEETYQQLRFGGDEA